MTEPTYEITQGPGLYTFVWPEGIRIRVSRLRERGDTLSAELRIEDTLTEPPIYLDTVRFNLLSSTTRGTLVRQLATLREKLPWDMYLRAVTRDVLHLVRQGDPPIIIGEGQARDRLPWLIEPLVLPGRPTLCYGRGGSGKSYIGAGLALAMVLGAYGPFWNSGEPVNAGYVDYEDDEETLDERLIHMLSQEPAKPSDTHVYYRRQSRPLVDDADQITEMVHDLKIGFLVIDSFTAACGAAERDPAAPVNDTFNFLRGLPVTPWLIDHPSKEHDEPYGSIYKFNRARAVWRAEREEDTGLDAFTTALSNRKLNNGRRQDALGFRLSFTDATVQIDAADLSETPKLAAQLPIADRILKALRHGRMLRGELLGELQKYDPSLKDNSFRQALIRLEHRGRISGMRESIWLRSERDDGQ